ncbi:MAG: hypothetical protein AAB428_03665, partial [Patescibacteria group bacterium]
ALRGDNGRISPETMRLVEAWTIQREVETERDPANASRAIFEGERAELYLAVGDRGEALECFRQALYIARQEKSEGVYKQIVEKVDNFGLGEDFFSL